MEMLVDLDNPQVPNESTNNHQTTSHPSHGIPNSKEQPYKLSQLKNSKILSILLVLTFILISCLLCQILISTTHQNLQSHIQKWNQSISNLENLNRNNSIILKNSTKNLTDEIHLLKTNQNSSIFSLSQLPLKLTEVINTKIENARKDFQNFTHTFANDLSLLDNNLRQNSNSTLINPNILNRTLGQLADELFDETFVKSKDCFEIQQNSRNNSLPTTMYRIYPFGSDGPSVRTQCEFDGGIAWTVIQKRSSGPIDFFYRNWTEYEKGFMDINGNYWIGLKTIRALTLSRDQVLRIELEDWDGKTGYANYGEFYLDDASDFYRLHVGSFQGSVGDSMTYHGGHRFTTLDVDNDPYGGNCAQIRQGGWWYNNCVKSNLNGYYRPGPQRISFGEGIVWEAWKGYYYSLKKTEMKIRRR